MHRGAEYRPRVLLRSDRYKRYQGKDGNTTDEVVETKVRQIVDYVDNDVVFSDVLNVAKNGAWSNTTIEYLLENKLFQSSPSLPSCLLTRV